MAENHPSGRVRGKACLVGESGGLCKGNRIPPLTRPGLSAIFRRMNTTQTPQTIGETQWCQGILANLSRLNNIVRLDPQEFADDHLREIEEDLADLLERVQKGII